MFTVTRFCISLCICFFTFSTSQPLKTPLYIPLVFFIILTKASTHGWAHWWCNMSAPPFLPPSSLSLSLSLSVSLLLPPLRWNLKAKSGGCWEMNFRKRFHSFHNTVSLSPLTANLTSDSRFHYFKLTDGCLWSIKFHVFFFQARFYPFLKTTDDLIMWQYFDCEMTWCLRAKWKELYDIIYSILHKHWIEIHCEMYSYACG